MHEQPPQPSGGEQSPVNSYGTDDPEVQARIEQARSDAREERLHDRARLEHFVGAGVDPDDAEVLIDFEHLAPERQALRASASDDAQNATARTPEQREAERANYPEIHLRDVSSQKKGIDYGLWIDANQSPDELDNDIDDMLANSPIVGADEWAIDDVRDFAGLNVVGLTDTVLISQLARGVAEHGAAYGAYVELVGLDDVDLLGRFTDLYVGDFDSSEAWACSVGEDLDWPRQLDEAIHDPMLRRYVVINYAAMAREGAPGWDVVQGSDGRTHVFMR